MNEALTRRVYLLVVVCALWASGAYAADGLSGTWSSGERSSDLTFVFRVQGDNVVGIVCGRCDDPASVFRIADGRILDSARLTFVIVYDDGGPLFAKVGPYRAAVTGTLDGNQLTLQTKREGTSEPPTRMVLNRVLGKREASGAATGTAATASLASAIDGRWVAVGRVAQQNLTLKVRGNRVSGLICGPCDDPNGVFLVEDGRLDGNSISFYIHHFDPPGLRRNFMTGTIDGNVMKFTWVREGRENEPGGEMTFTGPIRGPVALAQTRAGGQTRGAAACDRECLRGFITRYLDAMVAHTPATLALAPNVRFTEDTVEMKLGDGLWKGASKIRPYRLDILDTAQGVAASQVVVEEAGSPVMLALRLKIVNNAIAEVETQVTRNQQEGAIFAIDALQSTNAAMTMPIDPAKRSSRAEAITLAEYYPAGLEIGSFVTVNAPFASDAYRFENGRLMAGKGCTLNPPSCEDIKGQKISTHPGLSYRVLAVDEELGITLLRINFGRADRYGVGNALMVWEAFKVYGGQIHAVEAFMKIMPADAGSGWDTDVRRPVH